LSTSEQDILALLARGRSNSEIAFLLGLSENAMLAHVKALMGHLGLNEPLVSGGAGEARNFSGDPEDRPQ